MAAKHSTTTHLKFTTPNLKPTKINHPNNRETTISSSAGAGATDSDHLTTQNRKLDPPTVVSPHRFFCCPASKPSSTLPITAPVTEKMHSFSKREIEEGSPEKPQIGFSPDRLSGIMDPHNVINGNDSSFPSSFNNFNSALTAGLLNPMSPPSPPVVVAPPSNKIRSSPTLFEMMSSEPDGNPKTLITRPNISISPPENQNLMLQRISNILSNSSPGNQFNDSSSSDMKLNLSSKDGVSVTINVHSHILIANSRFFATKITDRWMKQQRALNLPYCVEICDCDDVLVYIATMRLMYCKDVKKKLIKEDVTMVLGILKVSTSIGFDAGILSSLEYLEAAPWAEDEEEKVALLLSELQLEGIIGFKEVLKRVSVELTPGTTNSSENEEILLKLLHVVLEGKDEKARREMKGLVLKMLRENSSQNELRKESLYSACDGCLESLRHNFLKAANGDFEHVGQISRHADNLNWVLDILIDRQIGEDFSTAWASQVELSNAHPKVPVMHRYAVSKVSARLFVGIGKGQILVSKETRRLLLQTWLVPFYDDFGWMRRVSKGLEFHVIEDCLSNTILTLPLAWQQEIFLAWFNRFLNSSEDCPNIKRGFEVWWRRSFWRRNDEPNRPQELRVITAND